MRSIIHKIVAGSILALMLIVLILPMTTHAQQKDYTLLAPLPCVGDNAGCTSGQVTDKVQLDKYVIFAFNLMIGLAAVAAVVMIVWSGFEYIYTASFTAKKASLDRVWNAIWGLVMALVAFLILRTVNPQLVAIHGDLVEPLGYVSNTDPLGYFKNLQNDVSQYAQQSAEMLASIRTAAEREEQINTELRDIESQLEEDRADLTSEEINALELRYEQLRREAFDSRSTTALNTATGVMDEVLRTARTTTNNGSSDYNYYNNRLDYVYTKNLERIQESGGTIAQEDQLTNKYHYAKASLAIADLMDENSNQDIRALRSETLNNVITNYVNKIPATDPLRTQIDGQLSVACAKFKSSKCPK